MELFLPTRFDDLDLQEGLDLVLLENAFHSFANLLVGLELILSQPQSLQLFLAGSQGQKSLALFLLSLLVVVVDVQPEPIPLQMYGKDLKPESRAFEIEPAFKGVYPLYQTSPMSLVRNPGND